MKKNYFLIIALLISSLSFGQLTINEIYYSDATDFVELKGPVGFDLTGWSLLSYSHQGTLISTYNLKSVKELQKFYDSCMNPGNLQNSKNKILSQNFNLKSNPSCKEIKQKIKEGLDLVAVRLIQSKKQQNREVVIMQDSTMKWLKGSDLKFN